MPVNSAFFPYQHDNRQNLLALAVATQQQVVWATGTHTSTPVLVFTYGVESVLKPFTKLLHHRQLGELLADVLTH
jgi:alkaline phosphatase